MSDTTDVTSDVSNVAGDATAAAPTRRRRSGTGLSAMLLPELQSLAASLGISGTARMRKGELISAISERQGGAAAGTPRPRAEVAAAAAAPAREEVRAEVSQAPSSADQNRAPAEPAAAPAEGRTRTRRSRTAAVAESRPAEAESRPAESRAEEPPSVTAPEPAERVDGRRERGEGRGGRDQAERTERGERADRGDRAERTDRGDRAERGDRNERGDRTDRGERVERNDRAERTERGDRAERGDRNERVDRGDRGDRNDRGQRAERDNGGDDDDENGGRRGRRSRFRDRRRGRGERGEGDGAGAGGGREPQVSEDDVLVPVAGIIDVLDNYAFVRTTGYLAGPNDVYVSMSQIKRYGLRRGDAITGAVRTARDGEQRRDKYNPLVRLDTINGMEPDEARRRPEFYKLTPLYPQERLRLETEPHILTTRVIDLVMPIGKGQRALIVSPPKAGKTMVLQAIANAITHNNPECHLMVVLVDERPEEVTDMQRSVKGEVIAATFDRPPQDHTTVAELAIERAKRLVELGHDVVVLLDSVTRLGRSYNLAAPASGRIMSGGIDSTALYPPKRFLGAARNIENGGSLTILATALVETGSMADTVIFEEFKGTGNAELKLDRKIADKRTFPAIDIHPSGTRKEEILLAPEELAIIHKLRKVLHSLDSQAALDLLLDRLKQSRTNIEFLMQIAKSTPGE
ncbi:transcription termination factor Rho [Micromonospora sp. ATCC 39149]|uniref:Transcription termination factor Rho n=1 Tax=Micromonospora carbonacea TaxID=47853 RepID=A0A7D5YBQ8_9ACTN|nr:transcription termination factor Rho [Micromonospora sp. ATCC 39149]EEP71432.1 transcription termination factor Rho [Micromonospora sp. ATCC 39149]QLJ97697.1 transcription termination factor Rho [Micromonospora carbonacea]